MINKKLIRCPNCEVNGQSEILGEINKNGEFVVLRFHKGSTIINSNDMVVKCGKCGEEVYRKEVNNDNSNIGKQWFYREAFVGSFVCTEAQAGTN